MSESSKSSLSPEDLEKARKELNEVQSEVPGHINDLREKVLERSDLNVRTDDAFLLRFLRARKFDQDRALQLIENYCKQQEYYPDLFSKTLGDLENALSSEVVGLLPNRDPEGRAVLVCTIERWNTNDVSIEDLIYEILLALQLIVEEEATQIHGLIWIVDLAGLSMTHITHMTPWKIQESVSVLISSFPLRFKGIHYVNESPLYDAIYYILRPLLSKKMQERIVFHGNCMASLHEYVTPEILPEEFGGDLDPLDHSDWNEKVKQFFEKFSEDPKNGFKKE